MADLTDAQLAVARSWIGTSETDDEFQDRYDRLGTLDAAILESLRAQLASLRSDQPGGLSTPEGLSLQVSENMRQLAQALKDFAASGGTSTTTEPVGSSDVLRLHRVNNVR